MRRSRLVVLAVLLLCAVPALASAAVKRGVYVDSANGAHLETNAQVSALKTLQVGCLHSGS